MIDNDRIIKINIEEEMRSSYIDYSMSVIVARALPDVRDGTSSHPLRNDGVRKHIRQTIQEISPYRR